MRITSFATMMFVVAVVMSMVVGMMATLIMSNTGNGHEVVPNVWLYAIKFGSYELNLGLFEVLAICFLQAAVMFVAGIAFAASAVKRI